MSPRARLPNRRASTTFTFDCGPHRYVAPVSYFPGTDRLAEIFLGNGRAGSDIDAAAKDSAVVASIALQHGVPVDVIRKALLRSQGKASSPLGAVLDAIAEQEGGVMSATNRGILRTSVRAGAAKTMTSGFACTFRRPPIRCGCTKAVSASSRAASWKACR
jgi:hypothetical protein